MTCDDVHSATDPDGGIVVEYCVNNAVATERSAVESAADSTAGVACLERCGRCRRTPYVLVNGTPVTARSPGALVEALREVSDR